MIKSWQNYLAWASALLVAWNAAATDTATVIGDRVNVRAAARQPPKCWSSSVRATRWNWRSRCPPPARPRRWPSQRSACRPPPHLDSQNHARCRRHDRCQDGRQPPRGPGTNYSVVGKVNKGETVQAEQTQDEWVKIKPTPNCFAFVAVKFLQTGAVPAAASSVATPTPPAVAPVPASAPPSAPGTPPAVTPRRRRRLSRRCRDCRWLNSSRRRSNLRRSSNRSPPPSPGRSRRRSQRRRLRLRKWNRRPP